MRPFFERKSINQLDAFLKSDEARQLFDSKERDLVCSASTIERTMSNLKRKELKDLLRATAMYMRRRGMWKGLKGKKVMSIDGSYFGKTFAACLEIVGKAPIMLGYRKSKRGGREYQDAMKIVKEELKSLGKGSIDIVVGDGLYLKSGFFTGCRKYNVRGVVKYTPHKDKKKPVMLADVDKLIEEGLVPLTEEFTDEERLEQVKMWKVDNNNFVRIKGLTVIRVHENKIKEKTGELKEYYIVIDGKVKMRKRGGDLTIKDYRELAKGAGRWSIEIECFRSLNQLMSSKRKYFKKVRARENMLTCILISFNLLSLYEYRETKRASVEVSMGNSKSKQRTRINLLKRIHEGLLRFIVERGVTIFRFDSS